jgi:predicted nucleic acid-binding protein
MSCYRIYLDVCCLNRALDDLSQDRIRLEAEAVLSIYRNCREGIWSMIRSDALDAEISRTPDSRRRVQVNLALAIAHIQIPLDPVIRQRAVELAQLGFKSFDAVHLATAEVAMADILLTTDDRLLRRAIRYQEQLRVKVANPVSWLISIHQDLGDMNDDDSPGY